jgi:DNA polymerase/3'-5' exonuclease PolX
MFMPEGAQDIVRKSTSDPKKLKAIADALGVADAASFKSARVELSRQGGGGKGGSSKGGSSKGGGSKGGGSKGSAKKASGKSSKKGR